MAPATEEQRGEAPQIRDFAAEGKLIGALVGEQADGDGVPASLHQAGAALAGRGGGGMVASRDVVARVVEIGFGRRAPGDERAARRQAARWLRFLERESGVLVAPHRGLLGFCHPVLMQYLAARGLVRRSGEGLAEVVAARWASPDWRDVCMLAIRLCAREAPFLDDLSRRLAGAPGGRVFLEELRATGGASSHLPGQ